MVARLFLLWYNIAKSFLSAVLVHCPVHISPNNLTEFLFAALSLVNDATASPPASALQSPNSFCVILLKMNGSVH